MKSDAKKKFSLTARFSSFSYAFHGLIKIIHDQHNFRIHLAAAVIVVTCGFIWRVSPLEWTILVLCIGFVLSIEAINTAIESIVDFVSPEYHELAGKIKDIAAAAVLVAAFVSAVAGLIIFIPKIIYGFCIS
jgi:diacylglycerol kinase